MIAHHTVAAAGKRRRALNDAMSELESVTAAASGTYWRRERVENALAELTEALEAHMEEVEGSNGLLSEILSEAPRLTAEVGVMKREHAALRDACQRLWSTVGGARSAEDIALTRRRVTTLLGRLTLHRQRGSDLVYEAYFVDIAAAD